MVIITSHFFLTSFSEFLHELGALLVKSDLFTSTLQLLYCLGNLGTELTALG